MFRHGEGTEPDEEAPLDGLACDRVDASAGADPADGAAVAPVDLEGDVAGSTGADHAAVGADGADNRGNGGGRGRASRVGFGGVGSLVAFVGEVAEVRDRVAGGTLGDVPDSALHGLVKSWVAAIDELDALGAGLLASWDARGVWDATGARSGRAWLANTARLPHASARLRVAVTLAQRCPKVFAALVDGQVPYQAAATIAAAVSEELAEFFEPVEDDMVHWAATLSVRDLGHVIAHWRSAAENLSDVEPDERRYHQRHATHHETFNGMVSITALVDPEGGHLATAAIDQVAEQLRRDDQAAHEAAGDTDTTLGTTPAFPDRRRSLAQRRADALVLLLEAGAQAHHACDDHPGGPNARIGIHLPWELFANYLKSRTANPDHDPDPEPEPKPDHDDPRGNDLRGEISSTDDDGNSTDDGNSSDDGDGDIPDHARDADADGADTDERYDTDGPHDPHGPATHHGAATHHDETDGCCDDSHVTDSGEAPSHRPLTLPSPTTGTGTGGAAVTESGSVFGPVATFERLRRPLDAPTLERLLCDSSLARIILDATGLPLDMGRAVRTATPTQRRALAIRDGGCAFPDCSVPAHLTQAHHIKEWDAHRGPTNINNLVLLCPHHHRLLHRRTRHRWRVHMHPTTHRPTFTPPADTPWARPPPRGRPNPDRRP